MATTNPNHNVAVTTSPLVIFDTTGANGSDQPCSTYWVYNRKGSVGNLLVNVAGLHTAGNFLGLEPGCGLPFKAGAGLMSLVTVEAESGTCTIDHGPVVR
ncbi:MAG: hypothetical protein JWO57_664 [Pseudonocardiales bacterium]|nr:hypothetical protein [Pseudonocardiales bacterium]